METVHSHSLKSSLFVSFLNQSPHFLDLPPSFYTPKTSSEMLSRSASLPLPRSLWINEPPSESLIMQSITKLSPPAPPPAIHFSLPSNSVKMNSRTCSELNLKDLLGKNKMKLLSTASACKTVLEDQESKLPTLNLSISTLSLGTCFVEGSSAEYSVLVGGSAGGVHGGGGWCGGGGGGRGDEYSEWEQHGFDQRTDQYYQELIKTNPANALVLGNYAKFLIEVKEDYGKAEEYLGRAILAKANDGQVFSMYGGLMWDVHKDTDRAKYYFHLAVEAAPDDCYVCASYARFLWDVEEDEDDAVEDYQQGVGQGNLMTSSVSSAGFCKAPWTSPIAAS